MYNSCTEFIIEFIIITIEIIINFPYLSIDSFKKNDTVVTSNRLHNSFLTPDSNTYDFSEK